MAQRTQNVGLQHSCFTSRVATRLSVAGCFYHNVVANCPQSVLVVINNIVNYKNRSIFGNDVEKHLWFTVYRPS